VFWARPPQRVRDLVGEIQQRLKVLAPSMQDFLVPSISDFLQSTPFPFFFMSFTVQRSLNLTR
jgi:hypothetical protein